MSAAMTVTITLRGTVLNFHLASRAGPRAVARFVTSSRPGSATLSAEPRAFAPRTMHRGLHLVD